MEWRQNGKWSKMRVWTGSGATRTANSLLDFLIFCDRLQGDCVVDVCPGHAGARLQAWVSRVVGARQTAVAYPNKQSPLTFLTLQIITHHTKHNFLFTKHYKDTEKNTWLNINQLSCSVRRRLTVTLFESLFRLEHICVANASVNCTVQMSWVLLAR